MSIRSIIKCLIYRQYSSSDKYVNYLRSKGAKVGDGTFFYTPEKHPVDETALAFLEIGNNCRITDNVLILLHDYSYAVMRPTHHAMLLKSGVTTIGNNVFVGARSIILMNSCIGDNVIIGAGSVVSGKFESNVVIAGNPAKIICTLDEYYEKCLRHFDENAKCYYIRKSELMQRPLLESEMAWYMCLWKAENDGHRRELLKALRVDGDDKKAVINDVMNWSPCYSSYTAFLNSFEHKL